MAESTDIDDLRQQMQRIRCDLNSDVENLVEHAREMTDWRYYVREYPWACVATAAAVGFVVVPRRVPVMSPDARTLQKLARKHQLVVTESRPDEKGGLTGALFGMVSSLVMRGLLAYAGQQAGKMFGQKAAQADGSTETATMGPVPPVKPHKPR